MFSYYTSYNDACKMLHNCVGLLHHTSRVDIGNAPLFCLCLACILSSCCVMMMFDIFVMGSVFFPHSIEYIFFHLCFYVSLIVCVRTRVPAPVSPLVPPTGDSSGSENESGGQLPSVAMQVSNVRTGGSAGSAGEGMKEQPSKEPRVEAQTQERVRHALNMCISLLIILAISMGLGQIYGMTG